MTTSALSTPGASRRVSYARARLWLGISGVGTAVLAASAVLVFDLATRLLPSVPLPLDATPLALLPVFALTVLLFLPFDILGGAVIVRERPPLARFLAGWARGVAVQQMMWMFTAALLLVVARKGGAGAAMAAFVAVQLLLAQGRGALARLIAALQPVPAPERLQVAARAAGIEPSRIRLLHTADEGFVGGWTGIGARTLLLPARWLDLADGELVAVLRRRRLIAATGAHRRGVFGAIAWNTLGFAVVLALTAADLASVAGLVTMAAGMTLWAFLGVLLLPTPSRAAVFALDAASVPAGDASALGAAIERLDRWQDDEASRSRGVETVFHPVPARGARLDRLHDDAAARAPAVRTAAHHLARHALWLGWGTFSPIARAVHCNVGRPALWAMLPGD